MNPTFEPVAPLLVFAWGNPSRGDDALGPLFAEQFAARASAATATAEILTDFQLQVEHALDLAGRERVLFVDASADCAPPFEVKRLAPVATASFTTHALAPEALMQVYRRLHDTEPPPCMLLAIRGEGFALGQPPSAAALSNLAHALDWALRWLQAPERADPSTVAGHA